MDGHVIFPKFILENYSVKQIALAAYESELNIPYPTD